MIAGEVETMVAEATVTMTVAEAMMSAGEGNMMLSGLGRSARRSLQEGRGADDRSRARYDACRDKQ